MTEPTTAGCNCDASADPPTGHRPWCGTEPTTAATGDGMACDRCTAYAPFSVQDIVGEDRITRWFACSRHLATVLRESEPEWEVDAVEVRYLTAELAEQNL